MSDLPDKPLAAERSGGGRDRRVTRYVVAVLCLGFTIGGILWRATWQKASDDDHRLDDDQQGSPVEAPDRFPLPKISTARFRNASQQVAYVGTHVCKECHAEQHASYLHTHHSRSLEEINVSREPPNGEFHHKLSGRHYRVSRNGNKLKMREFVRDAWGREVVLADHSPAYALGSGNYARSYLVRDGDFLAEAPVTWYPRRKRWDMSAGYELSPLQPGFGREVGWGCLNCHSGRTEMIDNAHLRLKVVEAAIGCERCHGPGALHVKERRAGAPVRDGVDDSIVNLRHLSRDRQEDVCSQCHLSTLADVDVRGRSAADFRPGMRMSDFRVGFRVKRANSLISVSGQVLQMKLSKCYIESNCMTCTTCHDLHASRPQSERIADYRRKCLNCHRPDSCRLPLKARRETKPQDNCITCHMPKGRTDIPHLSFANHRVGIHNAEFKKFRFNATDELVPVTDVSRFPEHERLRLLGLANDVFASSLIGGFDDETRNDPSYRELGLFFESRGRRLLDHVQTLGLRDPVVDAYFSRAHWRKQPDACIAYAESALKSPQIGPETRSQVLFRLATSHFDQGRFQLALPYLKQLETIERNPITLMLLGICYQKQGNLPGAVRLVKEAIRTEPARADLHIYLASIYRQLGKATEAERHEQRAKLLNHAVPQPR